MSGDSKYPAYPWERTNGMAGPQCCGDKHFNPCRPPMNHDMHRKNYFYTVLFLDDY